MEKQAQTKLIALLAVSILLTIGIAFALDFTPKGNVDMQWRYWISNGTKATFNDTLNITNTGALIVGTNLLVNNTFFRINSNFTMPLGSYIYATQNWSHTNYPSACTSGYYVTQIGDTIVCTSPSFFLSNINMNNFSINNISKIGIGTSAPTYDLHVLGNVSFNTTFYVTNIGYVGIGTSNPNQTLEVVGNVQITNGSLWQSVYASRDNLFLYLTFSENGNTNVYDSSKYDRTITVINVTKDNGKYGLGLTFNATSSYNALTFTPTAKEVNDLRNATGFTYMFWIKSLGGGNTAPRVMDWSDAKPAKISLAAAGNSITFFTTSNNTPAISNHIIPINIGDWTHIAYSLNGTAINSYKNGVLAEIFPYNGTINVTSGAWQIGDTSGGTRSLNATLDEFMVFTRGLTQEEIRTQYLQTARGGYVQYSEHFSIINSSDFNIFNVNNTGLTIGTGGIITGLNGNLGIGTINPVNNLNIVGTFNTTGNSFFGGQVNIQDNQRAYFGNSQSYGIFSNSSGNLWLNREAGSGNIVIPLGKLGIGTINPSQLLEVMGNINATGNITTNQMMQLQPITLPSCIVGVNGTIGRNTTKLYYCDGAIWNALY